MHPWSITDLTNPNLLNYSVFIIIIIIIYLFILAKWLFK